MTRTIDVHNHLFPIDWVNHLEKGSGSLTMKREGPTAFTFYSNGIPFTHVTNPGHYDPEARLKDMERYSIDVNILSLTTPSVDLVPAHEGIYWAKKVNDYFAELCHKYPKRFYAYATLPFQNIDESVKEMERAYKHLGVKGIMMFSNINGKPICSPEFDPVYTKAAEFDLPIIIHPAPPMTGEVQKKHGLPTPLFGFIFDTTMAIISLIFAGVLEKYPKLKFVHSHLGGVVPYMVGRIDDCARAYRDEYKFSIPKMPSEYYKNQVYVDSISYHLPAMKCCWDWMGPDHIMLGTDYAHPIGHIEKSIKYVKDMNLSEQDTNKILGENAARVFKLK
jgi:aminocarboxymuconate-semialdehyde decarboxylase